MTFEYDVLVIGAGHAGCEAAYASATMGSKTLLITMNMQTIAQMSCNPAMGGVGKGQIIREIDALGGMSGVVSDESMIQFRMLNSSKGQAMWSPRTQNDRMLFAASWRKKLEQTQNLFIWQEVVNQILIENNAVVGAVTPLGIEFRAKAVILTSGTFLNGVIHIGDKKFGGGRTGEKSVLGLTEQLISIGFQAGRMKTGTPPRLDGRSINYEALEEQKGDENPKKFSFSKQTKPLSFQKSCFVAYTNPSVHDELKKGFHLSPMFNGDIQGTGPRYCPSIEDKINRFSDRDRHQLFIEPEGWDTVEIYVNGFSSSLPYETQYEALRKVEGLEKAVLYRPGYAIEYDYFPPVQLSLSLETKLVENLFFAGQINGTTGYEEAACQGLMAGINAHRKINNLDPLILDRSQAYIGVLIDDLVTKGTEEPYRMFTSRAEHRISLRQDNADLRLTKIGYQIGLAKPEQYQQLLNKEKEVDELVSFIKSKSVSPEDANSYLEKIGSTALHYKQTLDTVLRRPEINIQNIMHLSNKTFFENYDPESIEEAEIYLKYESYIEKEQKNVIRLQKTDFVKIPADFDYTQITAISSESREKLQKLRPQNLGQASRISGISPADITIILMFLEKQKKHSISE
jgi:tRNA uridine 5-carboxymethylaminomethyl modification enzyme